MRSKYLIRPLSHGMDSSAPSLHLGTTFSPVIKNVKIYQNSIEKRWGYTSDRTLAQKPLGIILFQTTAGDRYTVYLTETDACKKETGVGETFSYITETHTTGTIAGITADLVTGIGTGWSAGGIAAGDQFILDSDHSAKAEPDVHWATVKTVWNDTTITLTSAYTGAYASGTYKIRKIYTVPANERWSCAVVDDNLCFSNGNTAVQIWTGAGYSTPLNATYADGARYILQFANRLLLADTKDSGIRLPNRIAWSKEGDPTNWTDTTSGANDFVDTDDFIMGMSQSGPTLVIYKINSIVLGNRTGTATAPIALPTTIPGVGCVAPYSIASAVGFNAWLGQEDFYVLNGNQVEPIGEKMRYKFYDVVDRTEAKKTWAFVNPQENEILWFAETSGGQVAFVWDYKTNEWSLYEFADSIAAAGRGAI